MGCIDIPDWANPKILTHPNIPDPLHRVNPRTVKGRKWWDRIRYSAYELHDHHCHACGVHASQAAGNLKRLECHEQYRIDYEAGRAYYVGAVALCPWCHNFIHSGRLLALYQSGKRPRQWTLNVVMRGLWVLKCHNLQTGNNLYPNPKTLAIAYMLKHNWSLEQAFEYAKQRVPYHTPTMAEWSQWRLVIDGQEYPPHFKTRDDWVAEYSNTAKIDT